MNEGCVINCAGPLLEEIDQLFEAGVPAWKFGKYQTEGIGHGLAVLEHGKVGEKTMAASWSKALEKLQLQERETSFVAFQSQWWTPLSATDQSQATRLRNPWLPCQPHLLNLGTFKFVLSRLVEYASRWAPLSQRSRNRFP